MHDILHHRLQQAADWVHNRHETTEGADLAINSVTQKQIGRISWPTDCWTGLQPETCNMHRYVMAYVVSVLHLFRALSWGSTCPMPQSR